MTGHVDRRKNRRWLRLLTRGGALAVAVVLAVPLVPWASAPLVLPAASPYVSAGAAIAGRSVTLVTLIALPVLLGVVLRRRWFCRWVCPVGLLAGYTARLSPVPRAWCERLPPLGSWMAIVTLAGACVGYPLLLWLDPLAMFAGLFGLWQRPLGIAGLAAAAGVPIALLIALVLPNAWCRRLCPLGGFQDLVVLPPRLWRRRGPAAEASAAQDSVPVARRSVLAMVLGGVWAGVGIVTAREILAGTRGAGGQPVLRPPGAVTEPQFAGLCVRCGNCVRVCPAGILHADVGRQGVAGFLAPLVRFEEDYCREDCRRCLEVCPSGAIRRLTLDEKRQAPIGLARVELELCLLYYDKECDVCGRVCPYEAVTFAWNEEEYIRSPRVDLARCPGCGACEIACPGSNAWEREHAETPVPVRKAIRVEPVTWGAEMSHDKPPAAAGG